VSAHEMQPVAEPTESKPPDDYDMADPDKELWPSLKPVLEDCEATVGAAFRTDDAKARHYQKRHRLLVFIAALGGMLAVLFAIIQLYFWALQEPLLETGQRIAYAEFVAAVVATFAVGLGLGVYATFANEWLLKREMAERYRLLKFRFLIHPDQWLNVASGERRKQLSEEVQRIKSLNWVKLKDWARGKDEVWEAAPLEKTAAGIDNIDKNKRVLEELVGYYSKKRLDWQQTYCANQANKRNFWGRYTRRASQLLFFVSIGFALGHYFYDELFGSASHGRNVKLSTESFAPDTFSLTLILLAACFPVVGAAVRTLSSAYAFGRNTLRFEATSSELLRLASRLKETDDPWLKLDVLQSVEKVLENERREWLRLMIEAEWFA
jgi:hypothetical protein